jgi:hypothetical protein
MELDPKTRAYLVKVKELFTTGNYDDIFDAAYDVMYQEWNGTPENEGKSWGQMLDWLEKTYGDRAVLYQMLGAFNYQVCNGGVAQWVDNGYASKKRSYRGSADYEAFEDLRVLFDKYYFMNLPCGDKMEKTLSDVAMIIETINDMENCNQCDNKRWVKCPDCDGEGTVNYGDDDDEDDEDTCDECHGDGKIYCPDCNPNGDLDEDQTPDINCVDEHLLDSVDTGYYKFNEEWIKAVNEDIKALANTIGIRAKARAMGLSESKLKESALSQEEKAQVVKNVIDILDEIGDDEFIVNTAEDMTVDDEDGLSDLDIEDMKYLIADFIVDGIENGAGWAIDTYQDQIRKLYADWT